MKSLRFPLIFWAVHRVLFTALLGLAVSDLPSPQFTLRGWENEARLSGFHQGHLIWDANWYLSIARDGFTNLASESGQRDTAFFPAFPMLIRMVDQWVGDLFWSGILVKELCFLLAVLLVFCWAKDRMNERSARKTVLILLSFPSAFILGHIYTEGLFLAAVAMSFLFAHRGRLWGTLLGGLIAGTTRVMGVMLSLSLTHLQLSEGLGVFFRRRVWFTLGPLLGLGMVMLWNQVEWGDPLIFVRSQMVPGWAGSEGLQSFLWWIRALERADYWGSPDFWVRFSGSISIFIGLGVSVYSALKVPVLRSESWFGVLNLLGSLVLWRSGLRFLVVLPSFFAMGALKVSEPVLYWVVIPLSLALQILLHDQFVKWAFFM